MSRNGGRGAGNFPLGGKEAGKKGDGRQEGRLGSRRGVLEFFVLFRIFLCFSWLLGQGLWRGTTKSTKGRHQQQTTDR